MTAPVGWGTVSAAFFAAAASSSTLAGGVFAAAAGWPRWVSGAHHQTAAVATSTTSAAVTAMTVRRPRNRIPNTPSPLLPIAATRHCPRLIHEFTPDLDNGSAG